MTRRHAVEAGTSRLVPISDDGRWHARFLATFFQFPGQWKIEKHAKKKLEIYIDPPQATPLFSPYWWMFALSCAYLSHVVHTGLTIGWSGIWVLLVAPAAALGVALSRQRPAELELRRLRFNGNRHRMSVHAIRARATRFEMEWPYVDIRAVTLRSPKWSMHRGSGVSSITIEGLWEMQWVSFVMPDLMNADANEIFLEIALALPQHVVRKTVWNDEETRLERPQLLALLANLENKKPPSSQS